MAVMTSEVPIAPDAARVPSPARRDAELEAGLWPFQDPQWRADLAALADSVHVVSLSWLADCRTIVALAARVPRFFGDERGGTPWTSFVREVAVAKQISDRAAHAEVALARGLLERHPCTVLAVQSGAAPAARARLLVELCAGLPAAVASVADRLLADRLGVLPPWRLKQEVELLWLRLDPDGAAGREALATADRSASRCSLPDAQAEVVLTGPAPLVQRWWEALTVRARALQAAGDRRSLAALRFDLAVHTDPRGLLGHDDLSAAVGIPTPTPTGPGAGSTAGPTAGSTSGAGGAPPAGPGGDSAAASAADSPDSAAVAGAPAQQDRMGAPSPGQPSSQSSGHPGGLGLGVRVRDDARCSRPVQANITVPAATALGLSDEPGWLEGYGWISAPLSRRLLTISELRKACIAPHSGQLIDLIDLADRIVRPRTAGTAATTGPAGTAAKAATTATTATTGTAGTAGAVATAIRLAVQRMVLTPHELRPTVTDPQPQHDPNPALRDFVQARDRWCDGPTGTQVPAPRTDTDHEDPYPSGPTAAWNLTSRAGRTHQLKHFGWTPQRDGRGTTWTSPAGQVVHVPRFEHPPPTPQHPLPDPHALAAHDAALTHARRPDHHAQDCPPLRDGQDGQDAGPGPPPPDRATGPAGPTDPEPARRPGPRGWPDEPAF